MLNIHRSIDSLNFRQLMGVYEEWNQQNGQVLYSKFSKNLQVLYAEQDFYFFIKEFFAIDDSEYCVWEIDGEYKAALRLEPFLDGVLLEALETKPEERKKGYAKCLVTAVQCHIANNAPMKIYAHVAKSNVVSLRLHKMCGFRVVSHNARFIDDSYHTDHYTLLYEH